MALADSEKSSGHSKELELENNSDIFMSKADFVAFPNGNLKILVHLPLIDASNKLKLYQHISTPFHINKDGFQLTIDGDEQEFIAIGSMGTLYAIMKNLDDCTSIRDIKICQK